jgi:hypothetical protein
MTKRADVDEDVVWLGVGQASPQEYAKPFRKAKKKNPVGFIWPKKVARKPKSKPRKR